MSTPTPDFDQKRTALLVMDFLSDGTDDPDAESRDFLLGRVFRRRAQVIGTGTLRARLGP